MERKKSPVVGFTLLEVMVAISILAIVLVAVFQSQSYSISLSNQNKFLITSSYLAHVCISEIETKGYSSSGTTKGIFGDDFPGYRWQVEVLSSPIPKTKKIKVTISHAEFSPEREFITYYYALES
ncbi:MAG: type II secretion system GspH family protein [Syntrophales bacterium]|nr:type II secretion system GspH family protein [Syntrophales bacterium]